MPNQLDPKYLSGAERYGEVAQILARGLLRARLRAATEKKVLDVSCASSDSWSEPPSEQGEKHE